MGGIMKSSLLFKIAITITFIAVTIMVIGLYKRNTTIMIIGILVGLISNVLNAIRHFKR